MVTFGIYCISMLNYNSYYLLKCGCTKLKISVCAHIIFLLYTAALKDTLSESPFLVSLYFVEEIINLKKL